MALFRIPRGYFVFSRKSPMALLRIPRGYFLFSRKSQMALLLLHDVTGKALFRSAVAWFCVEMESAGFDVLRLYEVLKSLC